MSDISIISNQYEKLVKTSDRIINSVITFQKKSLLADKSKRKLYPKLAVTEAEILDAKSTIKSFLKNVLDILDNDSKNTDFIPMIVLEDYKEKLLQTPYLEQNIRKMLLQDELLIDDISTLDEIISVIENERGILFRKMRTSRG